MKKASKRPVIGDILEMTVEGGFGYCQYVYNYRDPPVWGTLVRVFSGVSTRRPESIEKVVNQHEQFLTFTLVNAYVRDGIFTIVGRQSIPDRLSQLPVFKAAAGVPPNNVGAWWLWDGTREWRMEKLTVEEAKYSNRELCSKDEIADRIVSGWRPENDVAPRFIAGQDVKSQT